MRTGASLSAAGHGAMLALVVFGMPWFSAPDAPAIRVTEVSFVTEAEFAAAQSAAESAPRDPEAPAEAPAPVVEPPVVLDEPIPPPVADRPEPAVEPEPEPQVATLAPSFNAEAPLAAPPDGVTLVAPPAGSLAVVGPPRPRPVERIDATPAPPPPEVAQPAETLTPEQSAEPAPERLAAAPPTAPPEAAPEPPSAPVAAEAPAPSGAVASAAPPRARPVRQAPQQIAAAPAPSPPAPEAPPSPPAPDTPPTPAVETSQAEAILERLQAQQEAAASPGEGTAASTSLPAGPPITSGEREGLRVAVSRCWNVPAGLRDAQELRVTLAAELTAQGEVISGTIRLIEPASAQDGRFQQAYEAGRRALIRCSPYTDLPREKYAQWRNIEVVFNPEGMVSW